MVWFLCGTCSYWSLVLDLVDSDDLIFFGYSLCRTKEYSLHFIGRQRNFCQFPCKYLLSGAPNENIVQNHLNIVLLNVF